MNKTLKKVEALVDEEYSMANNMYPMFSSLHEGYAVIIEEVEEAMEEYYRTKKHIDELWSATKANDIVSAKNSADYAKKFAMNLASEAIQVAAMCEKFIRSFEGEKWQDVQ